MKTRLTLVLSVVTVLTVGYGFAQTAWKEFNSKSGRFTVQLPGAPKDQKQTLKTEVGPIDLYLYAFEVSKEFAYIVSYADYPEALVKQGSKDKMLEGARDGAVKNINGKLRSGSDKKVTLNGHPGREFIIDAPDNVLVLKARQYLVNNRLYQTIAVVPKGKESSADVTKFIDSFKLTK
jgi:hypothetical protein